ncbi:hypothetical protein A9P82_06285 [Arachidicoccus ginsenosidimutans]|uniref:hypothetical protein n=1 Tax=Arachidicoccus sp. BS20 TaxID=1850526 RepID=UPI0007F11E20|nr:hypothetical protein [Arachidicoccus sp. BS20]ANI88936.1 hypothetical protein A9P82_06285 [Arachidicoccus sp. BS20]
MRNKLLSLFLLILPFWVSAQNQFDPMQNDPSVSANYPKGIYGTIEDFENKTPSETSDFTARTNNDSIAYRFSNAAGKNIKDAFAISDGTNLYIRMKDIVKNFDKGSKGQARDGGNYYLKVYRKGAYLYTEDFFTSNMSGILGGAIASAMSRRMKAIIYLPETHKFKLFKNLKFFKFFIEDNYPGLVPQVEQEKGEFEVEVIRRVLSQTAPQ